MAVMMSAVQLDQYLRVGDDVGADYTLHGDCLEWWVEVAWPLWNELAALEKEYEHECRAKLV